MKLKRICAVFLCLILILSVIPGSALAEPIPIPTEKITTTPTGYTSAADVKYDLTKRYIPNWGARGENCEFLSPYANQFYLDNNTTYASLSQLSGGTGKDDAPNSALYAALKKLMEDNHSYKTGYTETNNLYKYTDCVSNDTSKLSTFYTGTMVGSEWVSGGVTYNKEHTWPKSKAPENSKERDDIMMLRPAHPSNNSSRNNTAYGTGSDYFDPRVSVHGDVARIALYVYVRWGNTSHMWGSGGVIENLDILLYWMEEDPVDTWEMGRNDAVESITGTRNVFVDYPELAWKLFGREVPSSATTPSQKGDGTVVLPPSPPEPEPESGSTYVLSTAVKDGDKVILVHIGTNNAMKTTDLIHVESSNKDFLSGVAVRPNSGKVITGNTDIVWTVKSVAGGFQLVNAKGETLSCANGLAYGTTDNVWAFEFDGNTLNIRSTTGKGDKGDPKYIEWYSKYSEFSTHYKYADGSNADLFALNVYVLDSTVAPIDPPTPPQPTQPPQPPQPTQPPQPPQPTQPKPTEPKPTDPPASEPTVPVTDPTEPTPTDPEPTDPKPTDPQPTDPKPTDPKPTEPKPTQPEPTQPEEKGSFPIWGIVAIVAAAPRGTS